MAYLPVNPPTCLASVICFPPVWRSGFGGRGREITSTYCTFKSCLLKGQFVRGLYNKARLSVIERNVPISSSRYNVSVLIFISELQLPLKTIKRLICFCGVLRQEQDLICNTVGLFFLRIPRRITKEFRMYCIQYTCTPVYAMIQMLFCID